MSEDAAEQVQKTVFASSQEALALTEEIHRQMRNPNTVLDQMSKYYFDGQGKAVRPALTLIMAGACNSHLKVGRYPLVQVRPDKCPVRCSTLLMSANNNQFQLLITFHISATSSLLETQ